MPSSDASNQALSPLFVTTRWSVVLAAQDKTSPGSAEALEALCRSYWYPLYALVRSQGHSPHDAQDLTQEFFARLLEKDYLQAADREKGRLRAFLRVVLKRFLANECDRLRAQKRGGGHVPAPFDGELAEQRYQEEQTDTMAPDRLFERQWAMTLLEQAMSRLRAEYSLAGKVPEFDLLKGTLIADRGAIPYAGLAATLQSTEGAARVAVHRLRKRFRELFRATIADTVGHASEVEDEMRHVVAILAET